MADQVPDEQAAAEIVKRLKSKGIFDQIRRDCLADITTKSSYLNLNQRIEGNVKNFLKSQNWHSSLNKNQLREKLRNNLNECGLIKGGVSYLVEQVVNPTNFSEKIADEVSFYLGLEKSDLNELNDDKLDDISDDEDELLKDDSVLDSDKCKDSAPATKETAGADHHNVEMKSNANDHDDWSPREESKQDKNKMTEEEFSRKFKNTFEASKSDANVPKEHVQQVNDPKTNDAIQNEKTCSNSSISDGSLICAPTPEPIESSESESDLLSNKLENEIANQLEQDIACVQHIYKDLVDEPSVNTNAAQSSKTIANRDNDAATKTTFTESQLTFKNKFNFTQDNLKKEIEYKETSIVYHETNMTVINEPKTDPQLSSLSSELSNDLSKNANDVLLDQSKSKDAGVKEKLVISKVNEERTPVVKNKNETKKLTENVDKVKDVEMKEDKIAKQEEPLSSKMFKSLSQSEFHKNQRIAKEKSEKLSKIQEELREKRNLVRHKLKEESSVKKSKEEKFQKMKNVSSAKMSEPKSSKSTKTSKIKQSGKESLRKSGKKSKNSQSADTGHNKKKMAAHDAQDFDSDVSSVHTSDLSDFDDQISLSSSDEEEHKKKKISMQQLKQILD